ncbi:MAG: alpha/beta hydrolase domain-containing protein, partial [Halioglobus sp.]
EPPEPPPTYLPITEAQILTPPDVGNLALLAQSFELADVGYQDEEYFIEGEASAFTNVNELLPDGNWEAEPAEQQSYRTRIVVHRPEPGRTFSGTVIVEWLNVTSGFDTPPSWGTGHVEMYRSGHIWIGVSAQKVGIDGREGGLAPLYLKAVNPERYGELLHPGDSFSYDIFTQVAGVLRSAAATELLGDREAMFLLAVGESQSASRLVSYINAVHPLYNPYDAYIVHSRGVSSSPLAQDPLAEIPTPEAPRIREDINVPVMTFQTETDVTDLGYLAARQPDQGNVLLWEVAGTAHADYYTIVAGRTDSVGDASFAAVVESSSLPGFISCDLPFNSGPMHYVFNTALREMDQWMRSGSVPPYANRLELTEQGDYQLDVSGNVVGGIRTPYVDAPSAVLSGVGNTGDGFCRLFGTTRLFDASDMAARYIDEAGFEAAVTEAAEAAVDAGFLLPEDAEAIIEWAPSQWQSQVGL